MRPRFARRAYAVLAVFLLTGTVYAEDNLRFGQPACPERLLDKRFFVICYNPSWKIPVWVGYALTPEDLRRSGSRTENFRPDSSIPPNERSTSTDYARTGYDRGHMAPAADFTRSRQAMSMTFLLTNMAPQRPGLNRRHWAQLEEAVRRIVRAGRGVWLFTGPIFIGERPLEQIGRNKVAVPTHYYKVILAIRPDGGKQMFASVMPNINRLDADLASYAITVNQVEELTGLNFFTALPVQEQEALESDLAAVE
jgi:endonuclease G